MKIYLLKQRDKKWYVGRTQDVERRWQQHLDGKGEGSAWTSVYTPLKLTILEEDGDAYDEDKHVKKQMEKYGIDNVRGGSYCNFHLTFQQKELLFKEIKNATDRCFKCGKLGHFSKDCTDKSVTITSNPKVISKPLTCRLCSVCNKPGHNKRTCKSG